MLAEKAEFWNAYHGLQYHHFKFGDARCMIVNTGWNGFDWNYQLKDHASWLDEEGTGNLRVAAYHKSEMGIMGEWAGQIDLGLAVIGHNHHLAFDNPYELGGRRFLYVRIQSGSIWYSTFSALKMRYLCRSQQRRGC